MRPIPPAWASGPSQRVRTPQQITADAPKAVQPLHVSIPLKPQQTPAPLPPRLTQAVRDEFAIRYLQKIGANSSPENIALVLQHLPLDKCAISAAWRSRGSLADVLAIDLNPKTLMQNEEAYPSTEAAESSLPVRQLRGNQQRREFRVGPVRLTFDDMKRKFLLPFKLAKSAGQSDALRLPIGDEEVPMNGHRSSNQTEVKASSITAESPRFIGTKNAWESHKRQKCAEERNAPPNASDGMVCKLHKEFFLALPLNLLGLSEGEERIRSVLYEALLSTTMVELVQSTMSFLHGTIINPAATVQTCSSNEHESLFVSITQYFARLRLKMERVQRPATRSQPAVLVPLLLLALRVDVETLVRLQYPFNFTNATEDMTRMLETLDTRVSQLLDPDANWSRLAVLETTHEAGQARASTGFQRARRHRRLRDQYFQTSEALHGVFPDPVSGKCRRVMTLRGGAGIGHYPELSTKTHNPIQSLTKKEEHHFPGYHSTTEGVSVSVASKLSLLRSLRRSQQSKS